MSASKKLSVSIVIPNYNGEKLMPKHLPNVIKHSDGAEIIVVDDASPDGSVRMLKKDFPSIKVVALKKNVRFAAACNAGFNKAKGKIVVLLNSDVSPRKGYLKPLLKHFKDESVFSVGSKEIEEVNGEQVDSGRALGKFKRGLVIHWRPDNQEKTNTLWTTGGSMAVSKKIWQKMGGMDTLFRPAYWEDIEICYRAQKRGYKILFEPKSVVEHHHETTNVAALGKPVMNVAAFKNQQLFIWKSITDIDLLIQYVIWLPYHLVITSIRTKGLFLDGFFKALKQFPEAIKHRTKERSFSIYSDKEVLAPHSN
ncbi:glycosyltransferase family 2 protein [Patescibacteria group bacterium]